jgi:hypothetical protein
MNQAQIVWHPTGARPTYAARERKRSALAQAGIILLAVYLIAAVSGLAVGALVLSVLGGVA